MKLKVVPIGNSKGIRLPKPLLKQVGISHEVEAEVEGNTLILKPVSKQVRMGWEKAFQAMSERGDDDLIDAEFLSNSSSWDEDEWKWK